MEFFEINGKMTQLSWVTRDVVLITVLLVDDHEIVRCGIKRILQDVPGIKVIAEAKSGEECITLSRLHRPQVVLMDVKMPGIGGLEATRKLQRLLPEVKIVILTMCKDEPYPSRLLESGAEGYLVKDCAVEELIQAIRAVNAGQRYISPAIAQQLAFKHLRGTEKTPFETLSERELQIMMMITAGEKIQSISDKLCLSSKTVNTYRYRIFAKLNVNSDVELTHLAIRHGVLDVAEVE